jgi:cobalt-zinc-cadmium efflux system protein
MLLYSTESRGRSKHQHESRQAKFDSNSQLSSHGSPFSRDYYQQSSYGSISEDHTSLWARSKRILDRDQNARNLFITSAALFLYSSVQIAWALFVESHSLFAASFWSLYMSISLGVTFLMQAISNKKPTFSHPYGFGRVEIVASFTNGSLLLFAGLYVSFEALEGLLEPVHAHEHIFQLALAVIGIILHSISATVFRDALEPRTESSSALYSMKHTSTLQLKISSLFSHLAGPVSILIVALSGSSFMDGIVAFIFSIYLFLVSIPLCWKSGRVLLQSVPHGLKDLIDRSLFDISRIPGVIKVDINKTHIWTISPGVHVGTIVIQSEPGADENAITQTATHSLKPYIYHLTIQVSAKIPHDHNHHGHGHDDHEHDDNHHHHHQEHHHHSHNHNHDHQDHHHDPYHDDGDDHDHESHSSSDQDYQQEPEEQVYSTIPMQSYTPTATNTLQPQNHFYYR